MVSPKFPLRVPTVKDMRSFGNTLLADLAGSPAEANAALRSAGAPTNGRF